MDIGQLYDLQKVDIAWAKVGLRLRQIQKLLGESDDVAAARQKKLIAEAELEQSQIRQRDYDLESQSLAARIQDTEKRLMSGEVSNPKELESLQASLDALRRQRAKVDDSAVEAMLKSEELSTQVNDFQATFAHAESEWKSDQSDLVQEGQKLKKQFVLLKQQRETLAGKVDPSLMTRYEQLRKRKNGVAVALLRDDTCGACHMQVPRGVISNVRGGMTGELGTCTSCGRILYAG